MPSLKNKDVCDAQQLARQNKKACLLNLCETIQKKVQENNGRMPHKFMTTLLEENKKSFNWLTRDMINSSYTRFKKRKRLNENESKEQSTIFKIQVEKNPSIRTSEVMMLSSTMIHLILMPIVMRIIQIMWRWYKK